MKKKVVALALAAILTMSMSMTAFAASSTTTDNSGNQSSDTATAANPQSVETVVAETEAGGEIEPAAVVVAVASSDGTAKAVTLETVIEDKQAEVAATVAAVASSGSDAASQVASILTVAPSEFFTATVEALSAMKGSEMVVNNCGSVKTAATAKDALGNTIASAGVIKHVTSGALILLMSVNADGTIEYVEGVVDPVTGAVMGAFQGTPSIITIMVLA